MNRLKDSHSDQMMFLKGSQESQSQKDQRMMDKLEQGVDYVKQAILQVDKKLEQEVFARTKADEDARGLLTS